jgi:hypothetical protein
MRKALYGGGGHPRRPTCVTHAPPPCDATYLHFTAAKRLCEAGSPVRILFTSGYSPGGHTHAATLPEGIQLLQKPWSLTDLFASVRTLLDR